MKQKSRQHRIKILKKKIDKLFSQYIRIRDNSKCVVCGSTERPQCGHLFSRVALATRWDDENAFCQCASCNMKHEFNPYPFNNWYIEKFGKDKWDAMYRKWNSIKQWNLTELEELEAAIKAKIGELGGSI